MTSVTVMWTVPPEAKVFLYISITALVGAAIFIIFLFGSRLTKNRTIRKEAKLRDRFQKSLNMILQMESSPDEPEASQQFYFSQLKKDMGDSDLARQVMIDQLIGLRKSLSGSSAKSLANIYLKLQLDKFSLIKLGSLQWEKKAQGISELSQMEVGDAMSKIRLQLRSKNATIREEALIGLVKLDSSKSLHFLDHYTSPLSAWMVMRIHQQLSLADKRLLPDFSRWYKHQNIDVVMFAIEMTRRFRQINNTSKLVDLLNGPELKVVILAIDVCGELQSQEVADSLIKIIAKYWSDNIVSTSLARSLGKVAHSERHYQKLADYLSHPNYLTRFEAAKALYYAEEKSRYLFNSPSVNSGYNLNAILSHVEDPLLQ